MFISKLWRLPEITKEEEIETSSDRLTGVEAR